MIHQLAALIVDESKWLPVSMAVALLAVVALIRRPMMKGVSGRQRVLGAMNLFFGVTIATMAFGHLLAVTTKIAMGTLEGRPLLLYLIGVVLAVPSWWLVHHTWSGRTFEEPQRGRTLGLNAMTAVILLALGLHNVPLAVPGFLNIGYHMHSRRAVGLAIAGASVVFNAALFLGSLIFLASGQSFEQFSGIE